MGREPEGVSLFDGQERRVLLQITRDAFSGGTRFHHEPRFSPVCVEILYERWISNLIDERDVRIFVCRTDQRIAGYVTVNIKRGERSGHIGLLAVHSCYRGKGIGSRLLSALDFHLYGEVDTLSVVTESFNYPALRAYGRRGFIVEKSWNVFHLALADMQKHADSSVPQKE
jgi:ribosomal protein S18 acetylase RimI-like enzyme